MICFLASTTLADSVSTTMLPDAGVAHDARRDLAPLTSTTQILQEPVGVVFFR